jgi:hypothetical protein
VRVPTDLGPTCRACSSTIANEPFEVSERYFGGQGRHAYVECGTCGTIEMVTFPTDIGALYPPLYRPKFRVPSGVRRWLLRQRADAVRGSRWNFVGRALAARYGTPDWAGWMANTGTSLNSRILDVGSSDGELLVTLSAAGYRNLTGIDPYIAHDREFPGGVRVLKRRLEEHPGEYDLIMLNHSLEHMTEPTEALVQVGRLLAPAGWVMVRLPVAGGYGWKTYREHWFGLEAPRHLVLPSADGMQRIAARAGFTIVKTVYDGHGGYYAMGEAAKRGLPMDGPRRPARQRAAEIFSPPEMAEFRALAEERNAIGDGDTAAFYLRARE